MAKRKQSIDEKKIQKYIKEGRGRGHKEKYIPWIKVQNFSSLGRVTRVKGWKSNRVHHLMSDLETKYFYLLEWKDSVIDIREQYPLLDRELVCDICIEKDIKQPIDINSREPIVLTTDFLITIVENGVEKNIARTLKYSTDLENKRVIEKFEIERAYWSQKGIDWKIVTEKDIPNILVKNVIWIHKSYYLQDIIDIQYNLDIDKVTEYLYILIDSIYDEKNLDMRVINLTKDLDIEYDTKIGTFLYLLKYSILKKLIRVDMEKDLTVNPYIKDILKKGANINDFSC